MAAHPNIGGAVCESSVTQFLVPRHKVRLTAAARVPCSNATNIGERKTRTQSDFAACKIPLWDKRPKNVYIVYHCQPRRWPKILQSFVDLHWATSVYEAKTRNRFKFAGVPQTRQQISAVGEPKFTILWGHMEEILLFNKFFRLLIHALVAKI